MLPVWLEPLFGNLVTAGVLLFLGHRLSVRLVERQDRRRGLTDRYESQKRVFEEYERLVVEAYRGSLETSECDRRRVEVLAFRARALFAFGDEKFANAMIGVIFQHEEAHRRPEGFPGAPDMKELNAEDERMGAEMLRAIRAQETLLSLPAVNVTVKTSFLIEQGVQKGIYWRLPPKGGA